MTAAAAPRAAVYDEFERDLEEALALAHGLLHLHGFKYATDEFARVASIHAMATSYVSHSLDEYRLALTDEVHKHADWRPMLLALDRAGWKCRKCRSAAVRVPERMGSAYVPLCRACRAKYQRCSAGDKAKAAAWFAKEG